VEHHLLLRTIGKPDIPGLDGTFQTVQPHIELQDRKSRRYRLKCIYSRTLLGRAKANGTLINSKRFVLVSIAAFVCRADRNRISFVRHLVTKEGAGLHESSRRWDRLREVWPAMRWSCRLLKLRARHYRLPSRFLPNQDIEVPENAVDEIINFPIGNWISYI
jgi:hypothetical protein